MQAPRCSRQNKNSPADSVLQLCSAYAILTRFGVTSRVYLRTATSGDCGTWSVMASPFESPIHYKESQQKGVKRHLFFVLEHLCASSFAAIDALNKGRAVALLLTLFVKASRRAKGMGVTERATASAVANPSPTARGKKISTLRCLFFTYVRRPSL